MEFRAGGWHSEKRCGVEAGGGLQPASPPPTLIAERHPSAPHSTQLQPITSRKKKRTVKQQLQHQSSPPQLQQCRLTENPPHRCEMETSSTQVPRGVNNWTTHSSSPSPRMAPEEPLRRSIRSIIGEQGALGPCARSLTPSPFPSRAPLPKGEQGQRERGGKRTQRPRAPETRFELHLFHPTSQVSQPNPLFMPTSAECRTVPHIGRGCLLHKRPSSVMAFRRVQPVGWEEDRKFPEAITARHQTLPSTPTLICGPDTGNCNAGCASGPPAALARKVRTQVGMEKVSSSGFEGSFFHPVPARSTYPSGTGWISPQTRLDEKKKAHISPLPPLRNRRTHHPRHREILRQKAPSSRKLSVGRSPDIAQ